MVVMLFSYRERVPRKNTAKDLDMSANATATIELPSTPDPSASPQIASKPEHQFEPERGRYARLVLGWTLVSLLLAGAAIILNLWLTGGGVTAVKSPASLFTSVGRVTGLFGAYLLLIQILLLARLPFVQWVVPFDRLTVIHRLNGKICLYLILAHMIFITVGYAGQIESRSPRRHGRYSPSTREW